MKRSLFPLILTVTSCRGSGSDVEDVALDDDEVEEGEEDSDDESEAR